MPTNDNFSCIPKEPLIKLDENGSAPIVKYRIPRETAYFAKSFIPLDIPYSCFKEQYRLGEPTNPLTNITVDQVESTLRVGAQNFGSLKTSALSAAVNQIKAIEGSAVAKLSTARIAQTSLQQDKIRIHGAIQPVDFQELSQTLVASDVELIYGMNFFGYLEAHIIPKREKLDPRIFLIEEYEIRSTYGDYGAAKVIKTMEFAPNEERTISITSYKKSETTSSFSKNILDSFSEESAQEMESMVEQESSTNSTESTEVMKSSEASASVSAGFGPIGGSVSGSTSKTSTANSAREEMARQLSTAMDKHVAKSSSNREMEINDSTTTTTSEGEESVITRVIKNPNFKTMNLVFRQMEQEYVTVIYLKDIEIGFCYDGADTVRKVKLYELDELLDDILETDECKNQVRCNILTQLMKVRDMNGDIHPFIEEVSEQIFACETRNDGSTAIVPARDDNNNLVKKRYWAKRKDIMQDAGNFHTEVRNDILKVPGIIMDVKKRILRTDGIVADVFLGHGEALDCFNQKLQDQATKTEILKNQELEIRNQQEQLKLDIVSAITDPIEKVEAYQKLFMEKCLPIETDSE